MRFAARRLSMKSETYLSASSFVTSYRSISSATMSSVGRAVMSPSITIAPLELREKLAPVGGSKANPSRLIAS